jgi:hypothetical protein
LGYSQHIYKYALLCGEPFCIYKWAYGSITNIKVLSRWNWILLNLLKDSKYKLRSKDKKKILSFTGFLFNRWKKPGIGFISRPIESKHIIAEFNAAKIDYIVIIDSNVNSEGHFYPISGNDDSAVCLNFYCYFFATLILNFKLASLIKFENVIYRKRKYRPLNFNNKLLDIYLFKNTFYYSLNMNDKIIKSSFLFLNKNFKYLQWMTRQNSLIDAHVKYSYFALYDLSTINKNWETVNRSISIPTFYEKSRNVFDPYVIF